MKFCNHTKTKRLKEWYVAWTLIMFNLDPYSEMEKTIIFSSFFFRFIQHLIYATTYSNRMKRHFSPLFYLKFAIEFHVFYLSSLFFGTEKNYQKKNKRSWKECVHWHSDHNLWLYLSKLQTCVVAIVISVSLDVCCCFFFLAFHNVSFVTMVAVVVHRHGIRIHEIWWHLHCQHII